MILPKYLSHIREAKRDIGNTFLFRGQSDARWSLMSGASRRLKTMGFSDESPEYLAEYLDYHRHLLDRGRRVIPFGQNEQANASLQLLAKLQHFGAATGLLDFTWDPLVALWFASEDPSCDGTVFLVGHDLPRTVFLTPRQEALEVDEIFSKENDVTGPDYLLWEPSVVGDAALRILGQRSVFVIGRPGLSERHVFTIEVAANEKMRMREELAEIDVSDKSIFRDIVGFCQLESARSPYTLSPQSHLRRANNEFMRGEFEAAVKDYGRALTRLRDVGETHFLRGNAYAELGRHSEAIEDYGRALTSQEFTRKGGEPWFHYAIYYNRGNMHVCLGNFAEAVNDYSLTVSINPRFMSACFNCGNAYFLHGKFAEAVEKYDKAMEIDGNYSPALINKALALVLQGKLEAAEECYQNALKISELPHNTLEPLHVLRSALVPLSEDGLTVKVDRGTTLFKATFGHADYHGESTGALFTGINGGAGNVGGWNLRGGTGFDGGPGVFALLEGSASAAGRPQCS